MKKREREGKGGERGEARNQGTEKGRDRQVRCGVYADEEQGVYVDVMVVVVSLMTDWGWRFSLTSNRMMLEWKVEGNK